MLSRSCKVAIGGALRAFKPCAGDAISPSRAVILKARTPNATNGRNIEMLSLKYRERICAERRRRRGPFPRNPDDGRISLKFTVDLRCASIFREGNTQ